MCDAYEMYDMNPPVSVYCDGTLPDGADSAHLALIVLVGHSGEQIMLRGASGIELLVHDSYPQARSLHHFVAPMQKHDTH